MLDYYLENPNEKAGAVVVVAAGLVPEKANNPPVEGGLVVELVLDALNENVDNGVFDSWSLLAGAPKEKVEIDGAVVGVELANENVEGGLAGVETVDPLPKKLKEGFGASADAEPNWNFLSSGFSLSILPGSVVMFSFEDGEARLDSRSFKCFS